MYEQTLYKVIDHIKPYVIKRLNKSKKWEYGYNKEHDVIVISKTGQIGEIYEIQNLVVDEVRHHRPFVEAKVSREGDAFYAGLAALQRVPHDELVREARTNVRKSATTWQSKQTELKEKLTDLQRQIAESKQAQQKKSCNSNR